MKIREVIKKGGQWLLQPVRPLMERIVYTMRSGPARGLRRRGGFMFIPFPPSDEERFLRSLDLEGRVVYDIGANIGVLTLFFAEAVGPNGRTFAFEPNPESILVLLENIRCNDFDNIAVFEVGIADYSGRRGLVVCNNQRGTGSMDPQTAKSFVEKGKTVSHDVEVFALDDFISAKGLAAPDFIKIDTEGMELACLRGMRTTLETAKPDLFIEMHGVDAEAKLKNAVEVLGFMEEMEYRVLNTTIGQYLSPAQAGEAARGHLYCHRKEV